APSALRRSYFLGPSCRRTTSPPLYSFIYTTTPPTNIYTLSLHDALPISHPVAGRGRRSQLLPALRPSPRAPQALPSLLFTAGSPGPRRAPHEGAGPAAPGSAQPVPRLSDDALRLGQARGDHRGAGEHPCRLRGRAVRRAREDGAALC